MLDENFSNLPVGLGMALIMNERARASYEELSETEKEHFILKCKDARSEEEMDRIVASLAPAENLRDLFDGPDIR